MGKDTFYIQEEKIADQQPPEHVCTLQKYTVEGHNGQAITPFKGLLEGIAKLNKYNHTAEEFFFIVYLDGTHKNAAFCELTYPPHRTS